jgi:hypothetical protein
MMYTGAASDAPLFLKAAYQFGGELAANNESFRSPDRDEKDDIAGYWKDGAVWSDMPEDAKAAALTSWRSGYENERRSG